MTRDLEETLAELGPEYRALVVRLRGAYRPEPRPAAVRPRPSRRAAAYLAAASALLVFSLFPLLRPSPPGDAAVSADGVNAYFLAHMRGEEPVRAILRTQRADGGWATDFLTRQNAAALRDSPSSEARIAYKRALRNLRARGVL